VKAQELPAVILWSAGTSAKVINSAMFKGMGKKLNRVVERMKNILSIAWGTT